MKTYRDAPLKIGGYVNTTSSRPQTFLTDVCCTAFPLVGNGYFCKGGSSAKFFCLRQYSSSSKGRLYSGGADSCPIAYTTFSRIVLTGKQTGHRCLSLIIIIITIMGADLKMHRFPYFCFRLP